MAFLPLLPNMASPLIERLEWLTDVQSASDGLEVRQRLRTLPRSSLTFSFFLKKEDAQTFKSVLYSYQGKVVQAPWWPGAICTTSLGLTHTTKNRSTSDFSVGELAVYFKSQSVHTVASVHYYGAGSVTIGTSSPYPIGTHLVPVRDFYLSSVQIVDGVTSDFHVGTITLEQVAPHLATTDAPDFDIMATQPDRSSPIGETWSRLVEELDFHTGARYFDIYASEPLVGRSFSYLLRGKDTIDGMRSWLHSKAGRYADFIAPTWQCDELPQSMRLDSDTIEIAHLASGVARVEIPLKTVRAL